MVRRVWQHKEKLVKGFTEKYGIDKLIYFETYNDIDLAIQREKSLKEWKREWKIDLVKRDNPQWRDLYQEIIWGLLQSMDPGFRRDDSEAVDDSETADDGEAMDPPAFPGWQRSGGFPYAITTFAGIPGTSCTNRGTK